MITTTIKNINIFIYFFKDILDASRKDIPIVMKPIEEQCKILRPELFAVSGKEVLKAWVRNNFL